MKTFTAVFIATGVMLVSAGCAFAQDATKGKSVFNQCMACHKLDANLVGPRLKGVIGRKAGSVADFDYSPLMKAASDAGLVWTEAEITEYVKNPTAYLKAYVAGKGKAASGSSKMVFMLANETQRQNVVAYLAEQK